MSNEPRLVDDRSDDQSRNANLAARQSLRDEMADAIATLLDRDTFLLRLARRVADSAGLANVAIYTRANESDLLRASTFPTSERLPLRLPRSSQSHHDELDGSRIAGHPLWSVAVVPLIYGDTSIGVLVARSGIDDPLTAEQEQLLTDLAGEMSPAIAVADEHYLVRQASIIDLPTGAYAYWYLSQRFDEEIARAQRTKNPITIVLARVLDFETVQYAIGYDRADQLLRDLASEYAGLTRTFDIVGMRSRADFSILLPDTDMAAAATVIARIHRRSARVIEKLNADHPGLSVQVVTGAAAFPFDGDRVPEVVLAAEQRLDQNETLHRRTAESA
jgi:diguanylate cyclase (GGDEF)-like protein